MAEIENAQADGETVPVNFRILPRTPSYYAQQVAITPMPEGVIALSFFEIQTPVNMSAEVFEQMKKNGVVADSVARIIMSPITFQGFARAVSVIAAQLVEQTES